VANESKEALMRALKQVRTYLSVLAFVAILHSLQGHAQQNPAAPAALTGVRLSNATKAMKGIERLIQACFKGYLVLLQDLPLG